MLHFDNCGLADNYNEGTLCWFHGYYNENIYTGAKYEFIPFSFRNQSCTIGKPLISQDCQEICVMIIIIINVNNWCHNYTFWCQISGNKVSQIGLLTIIDCFS